MMTGMHPCSTESSNRPDHPQPGSTRQKVASVSAVAPPDTYIAAAAKAGFDLLASHDGTVAAKPFIDHVLATKPAPRDGATPDRFRNLVAHIEAGLLAPTELVFRKAG